MISWLPGKPADLKRRADHFEITVHGLPQQLLLKAGHYGNGRLAIEAYVVEDGENWGTLTVNIVGAPEPAEDEIIVKAWSENEHWVPQLLTVLPHVFEDTGRRIPAGYAQAQVWKLKVPITGRKPKKAGV